MFNRIASAILSASSAVIAGYVLFAVCTGDSLRSADKVLLTELGVELGVIATLWFARSIYATWRKGIEQSGGGYRGRTQSLDSSHYEAQTVSSEGNAIERRKNAFAGDFSVR